jgi:hypothetical protein
MQVIAGFFGSSALAALAVDGAAFALYFKQLAQFAKLATSYFFEGKKAEEILPIISSLRTLKYVG